MDAEHGNTLGARGGTPCIHYHMPLGTAIELIFRCGGETSSEFVFPGDSRWETFWEPMRKRLEEAANNSD